METPVFWHQGLFLQPQHFQVERRHFQSLLTPFFKHLRPYLWGVGEMEISESDLANGIIHLVRGEFLFPDTSHVLFPGNAIIEPRSFGDSWAEGGQPLRVYLGLRKWNEQGENVTVVPRLEDLGEIRTRYVTAADPEEVQDLYQKGPSAQLQRLHYLLRLFWDSEKDKLGDYTLIPIAQLERTGDKALFSARFCPPSLVASGSEVLFGIVKDIRDLITSRGRQLESYKRDRGIHTAEFGARDMAFLLALRSLNRYIPMLHQMTDQRQVHPWAVYAVLGQIVGELSTFSSNVNVMGESTEDPPSLRRYDHDELWECFSSARALITRLLDEITAGPEYVMNLLFDGTFYATELKPEVFEGQNRFYLVFETEEDPNTVIRSLEAFAKLSSREALPTLIARALPGIKLVHLPTPPQELPRRPRALYFQVDHHSDQWAQVQKKYNLALYWNGAPEDLELQLLVVGRT